MLCFVVVMQSSIMNSHEVFIHIHQGCFAGTGAIVRLPQCQWSKPDGYGKISQCITTTKHSKAKTVCIFLGIYCIHLRMQLLIHVIIWVNPCSWKVPCIHYAEKVNLLIRRQKQIHVIFQLKLGYFYPSKYALNSHQEKWLGSWSRK